MKLTDILEKLADYCDDVISPKNGSYLIAKVKPREEKKQSSPIKQGASIRPSMNIMGKLPREFPDYKNCYNAMGNMNGPVRIVKR